jgi:hypothetical protein
MPMGAVGKPFYNSQLLLIAENENRVCSADAEKQAEQA